MGDKFWKVLVLSLLTFQGAVFVSSSAYGLSVGLPLDVTSNPLGFLTPSVVKAAVKTFGIVFDHRPYEPATPLGTNLGFDFGIEVVLVQVPPLLKNALADQGMSTEFPPILPNIRELNVHKGFGNSVDMGASILSYNGYLIWGADFKLVLYQPEEGFTWAIRLGYNKVHVPLGSVDFLITTVTMALDTTTWTPVLLLSKKLDFADPYMGFGYQYVTGGINVENSAGIDIPGISSVPGTGGSFLAFLGLSMRVPVFGLRLTLEGAYSPDGFNAIGTKVGFSF